MPSARGLSVAARLTLTMILVVALSWLLGGALVFQLIRLGILRRPPRPGPPPPPGIAAEPGRPGARTAEAPLLPPAVGGRPPSRRGDRMPPPPPGEGRFGGPPPAGREGGGGPPPRGGRSFWRDPRLLVNLGVGILLSLAAGVWLSRRFTRPLIVLAEGASALRAGHLDHRIPVTGEDEFGRVAVSLNQMAQRIEEQIRQLEQDARRRQNLLADVAHELRTPIARLKTMAEALRDGVASGTGRTERAARTIAESAAQMERMINDLLQLARLDLDELPLYPQPVDLRAAAADALRRHGEAAAAVGIVLHPPERGESVIVSADPHRLAQILDNLLDNAVSHAGSGAEVSVTVRAGDPAVVTVADTGRGISAEQIPYLFDAFYRGDPARTPGDRHSGLGLRIARGLARAHGGDLTIESHEGEATRAIVTLPKHERSPDSSGGRARHAGPQPV